jgi:hypothetical protein
MDEHPRGDLDAVFCVLSVPGSGTVAIHTFRSALAVADEYDEMAAESDDPKFAAHHRALAIQIREAVGTRNIERLRELADDGEIEPQVVDESWDGGFVGVQWSDRLPTERSCPRGPVGAVRRIRARPRERRARSRSPSRGSPSRSGDPDPDLPADIVGDLRAVA